MRRFAVLFAALLAGCGGGEPAAPAGGAGGDPAPAGGEAAAPDATPAPRDPRAVARARCPAGLEGCRAATGRVLYVEAVDPDGDGDAHFVLAGGRITAPGISTIAVRRELRPRRLPRVGDWISAAGVVWTGSYGQRQIEAEVLHVARR
jgi:hypothetical protein